MSSSRRPVDYRVDPFDLRLYTVVLELGTITAAAKTVGLSLAAASARLKALEDLVGAKLLERSKTGATPTRAGRALAQHAGEVLAGLEALHVEMARFASGLRGTVRLMSNTAALSEALPQRLGRFLEQHAEIDIELQELPSDAVLDALRRGVGDVGIVADHVDTGGLIARPWLDDRLVALLPRGAAMGAARSMPFAALLERPFVGLSADSGLSRFLLQQARRSGRMPQHRVRVASFDAVAQIVACGVGVAVMPLSAAARWRGAQVRIVALQDAWARRKLMICTSGQAAGRPAIQALVDALVEP
ncbi:LysR family transcriptional regulator [Schlegelella sp. S2-27]|uniref:LysR family transcriptional regulator n=1 Tax=Caldimonas mangrovi TaxID=2944811 RepID=A0ABT0YSN8_9BURK|nr:LysR family transcriptional regulator [Caldimonas mangrovi]MCM5681434.1 LysR family transcriptional regulator [Caldimonas mangrovi]